MFGGAYFGARMFGPAYWGTLRLPVVLAAAPLQGTLTLVPLTLGTLTLAPGLSTPLRVQPVLTGTLDLDGDMP